MPFRALDRDGITRRVIPEQGRLTVGIYGFHQMTQCVVVARHFHARAIGRTWLVPVNRAALHADVGACACVRVTRRAVSIDRIQLGGGRCLLKQAVQSIIAVERRPLRAGGMRRRLPRNLPDIGILGENLNERGVVEASGRLLDGSAQVVEPSDLSRTARLDGSLPIGRMLLANSFTITAHAARSASEVAIRQADGGRGLDDDLG